MKRMYWLLFPTVIALLFASIPAAAGGYRHAGPYGAYGHHGDRCAHGPGYAHRRYGHGERHHDRYRPHHGPRHRHRPAHGYGYRYRYPAHDRYRAYRYPGPVIRPPIHHVPYVPYRNGGVSLHFRF